MLRCSALSPLRILSLFGVLACLLVLSACKEKTPAEKVADSRAAYTVELNSWFPREPEPEPEPEVAMTEGESEVAATASEEAAASAEVAEGEEGEEGEEEELTITEPVGPLPVDVFFDLIVLFDGDNPLAGLTLDVSHADGAGGEKGSWRQYVELPSHIKGETKQVSFELADVDFEEGDQFSVALRSVVPPEERAEYREFATAGE